MLGILYMCCFEYDVIQKMISRFWKNIFSILISLLECRKKKKNLQHNWAFVTLKPVNFNFLYHHLLSNKYIFLRPHLYKYNLSMMIISTLSITYTYLYMSSFCATLYIRKMVTNTLEVNLHTYIFSYEVFYYNFDVIMLHIDANDF